MNIEINKTKLFLIIIVIIFITVSLMGTYLRNDFVIFPKNRTV